MGGLPGDQTATHDSGPLDPGYRAQAAYGQRDRPSDPAALVGTGHAPDDTEDEGQEQALCPACAGSGVHQQGQGSQPV